MTTKSNQSISKRVLMFCGSALVASTAVVSFSGRASARDVNAGPIWNNGHAAQVCPGVCSQRGWKWTKNWKTTIPNKMSVCGCGEWKLLGNSPRPILTIWLAR